MVDHRSRFWSKVDKSGECWLWTGAKNNRGYGVFSIYDMVEMAHRLAYAWHVGPLISGYEIDHLCEVKACVRPDHLEQVLHRVNTWRYQDK